MMRRSGRVGQTLSMYGDRACFFGQYFTVLSIAKNNARYFETTFF